MARRFSGLTQILQAAGDEVVQSIQQQDVGRKLADAAELLDNQKKRASAMEIFRKLDRDGSGELERREIRMALKELGIDPNSKLVQQQIKKFDADGSGSLDAEEFENFVDSILEAEAGENSESSEILKAFENLPYMTAVSHGDRMGLIRSAELHSFNASHLVMAYPPNPHLGHLSYSHEHVYLILSGTARLLLARGKASRNRDNRRLLPVAVAGTAAVRGALGATPMPVATLSPLTCVCDNLLPHVLDESADCDASDPSAEARWCLQPIYGTLAVAVFPKREWEAALGRDALVALREEVGLHASFLCRCAERARAVAAMLETEQQHDQRKRQRQQRRAAKKAAAVLSPPRKAGKGEKGGSFLPQIEILSPKTLPRGSLAPKASVLSPKIELLSPRMQVIEISLGA